MTRRGYDDVVLCAPVTVPYVRHSIRGAHWFLGRALRALVGAAGIGKDALDGLGVASFTLAPDTAVGVTQHMGLTLRWLDHVPMGGASGVVMLRRAARAVQCGDAGLVAVVAADTNAPDSFRQNLAGFSLFARDAVYPIGAGGPNASFAFLTDHYMRATGAERADFGRICVAQRSNALAHPHALFRKPLTLEEYLASRMIADPICLFDCVMPCAGAEAFLVTTAARARALGLAHVRLLATIERHNAYPDDPVQIRGGWAMDRDELWAQAGMGPGDMDLVQTYDDYPVMTLIQLEDLGFCTKGAGPDFVRRTRFTTDGELPLNTGGGQLSAGQAGAAGGSMGLVETIRQLTGRALGAPVEGARHGLACGFGMITYDRGLCSGAAVLAA